MGTGRFQEINEMDPSSLSYVVVDPVIDTKRIAKRREAKTIMKFDT